MCCSMHAESMWSMPRENSRCGSKRSSFVRCESRCVLPNKNTSRMHTDGVPPCAPQAGNDQNGGGHDRLEFSWGFGSDESSALRQRATNSGTSTPQTHGLPCGASSGWTYVGEGELGAVIALNVGGKLFTSSLDTFTRVKDSLLAGMLSGRFPVSRDMQGGQ